jgi:hypothetical protein
VDSVRSETAGERKRYEYVTAYNSLGIARLPRARNLTFVHFEPRQRFLSEIATRFYPSLDQLYAAAENRISFDADDMIPPLLHGSRIIGTAVERAARGWQRAEPRVPVGAVEGRRGVVPVRRSGLK